MLLADRDPQQIQEGVMAENTSMTESLLCADQQEGLVLRLQPEGCREAASPKLCVETSLGSHQQLLNCRQPR